MWTAVAVATLAIHLVAVDRYGYQRDELYFLSCAQHLAWGYVDQPPLIAAIGLLATRLFGDSLLAIRILPILAATATVLVTGHLARRLGGDLVAQTFAMVALAIAPFYLAVGNLLTVNAFEPLFWLGAVYALLAAVDHDRPRDWIVLGTAVGLGLLDKYTMGFFALAALAGLAITPARRVFLRPGFWAAFGIAGLFVAPSLVWQQAHGWPQLAVLHDAAEVKNVVVGPLDFYLQQVLMMNPLAAPIWIAGLWFVFRDAAAAPLRWFGWAYVVLSLLYLGLGAKVYYLAPIYPALFAAGGVATARFFAASGRAAWRTVYGVALLCSGLVIAPQAFPLLPLPQFLAYQRVFDARTIKMERHPEGRVPQNFADMLGWRTLVATLAAHEDALPPGLRGRTPILTHDYGQASAIDILGARRGLPPALSGHNNYYYYGTRGFSGDAIMTVGIARADLAPEYRKIVRLGTYHDAYLLPDFNDLPIYLCTEPIEPLATYWPHFRRFG